MVESVAKHLDVNGVLGTVLMIWKIHEKTVVFGFGWSYVQCWKNCLGYIGQTINLCVKGRSWKTVAITCARRGYASEYNVK